MSGFLPDQGNYQKLISYRKAVIIFDGTYIFCKRFMRMGDRTIDQMIQAARSGKQNIIEGSKASKTSSETEIKLTSVARASLEELLEDYRDYLRIRNLRLWNKNSKEALYVRRLAVKPNESFETYEEFLKTRPAETCANIIICLINQCNFLLDRQIKYLENKFKNEGGIREKMYKARNDFKRKKK